MLEGLTMAPEGRWPSVAGVIRLSVLLSLAGLRSQALSNDYVTVPKTYFASPEEEVQGILGERVVLPCEFIVDRVGKFNLIWQKEKITLTFNKNFVDDSRLSIAPTDINTKTRFDLQINGLLASDEGLYRCIASYENQFFIKNVTLLVKVPPTIDEIKSSAPLKTLVEGDTYALVCEASGTPQPSIVWYKMVEQPYIEAMNKEKIAVGEGHRYVMNNVTRRCDGTFMCIASNGIHPSASKKFLITVNYKPAVTLVNEEISQKRGLATMVMCVITGNPLPSFYWEFRSQRFDVNGRRACDPSQPALKHCMHIGTQPNAKHVVQIDLMINNLTADDFGVYYCVASSSLGEDRKAAHVLEASSSYGDESRAQQPEVFKPVQQEAEDPRPEVYTRRPPPQVPSVNKQPSLDSATEPGEMSYKHATGSTLQGAKGSGATSTSTPIMVVTLATIAMLLVR